jgi:O-antigen/teichoic acid export membrane protein
MQNLRRALKSDIAYFSNGGNWLLISQVCVTVATMGLTVLYANFLTIGQYGTYKYVLSLVSLFSLTSLSGVNTALARAVSRGHDGDYYPALKLKMRWSLLGALASACVGGYYMFFGNTQLGYAFFIVAVCFPFLDSYTLYQQYLNGKSAFKELSYTVTIVTIFQLCAVAIALWYTDNLLYIIGAYFGSKIVSNVFLSYMTLRAFPPTTTTHAETLPYGKHLSFMKGLSVLSASIYSLGLWQFGGATTLALFALAVAPAEQIRGALKYIEPLILPKTSKDAWDKRTLSWFLKKTTPITLITLLISGLYIMSAPFLFSMLFPQYMGAVWYSQLYIGTLILTAQSVIVSAILKAKKQTHSLHTLNIVAIVVDLCVCLPAMYYFSIIGLIGALIFSKVLTLSIGLYLLYGVYRPSEHT